MKNNQAQLAVAYIRTATQGSEAAQSINRQQEAIGKFCFERGIGLVTTLVDAGESGLKKQRPALSRLISTWIKKPEIAYVIIYDRSRLSRQMVNLLYIEQVIEDADKELICLSDTCK